MGKNANEKGFENVHKQILQVLPEAKIDLLKEQKGEVAICSEVQWNFKLDLDTDEQLLGHKTRSMLDESSGNYQLQQRQSELMQNISALTQDFRDTLSVYEQSDCAQIFERCGQNAAEALHVSEPIVYLKTCNHCSGSGKVNCSSCHGTGLTKCPACRGKGTVRKSRTAYRMVINSSGKKVRQPYTEYYSVPCSNCKGSGQVKCTVCKGKGVETCKFCKGKGATVITAVYSVGVSGKLSYSKDLTSSLLSAEELQEFSKLIGKRTVKVADKFEFTGAELSADGSVYHENFINHVSVIKYTFTVDDAEYQIVYVPLYRCFIGVPDIYGEVLEPSINQRCTQLLGAGVESDYVRSLNEIDEIAYVNFLISENLAHRSSITSEDDIKVKFKQKDSNVSFASPECNVKIFKNILALSDRLCAMKLNKVRTVSLLFSCLAMLVSAAGAAFILPQIASAVSLLADPRAMTAAAAVLSFAICMVLMLIFVPVADRVCGVLVLKKTLSATNFALAQRISSKAFVLPGMCAFKSKQQVKLVSYLAPVLASALGAAKFFL